MALMKCEHACSITQSTCQAVLRSLSAVTLNSTADCALGSLPLLRLVSLWTQLRLPFPPRYHLSLWSDQRGTGAQSLPRGDCERNRRFRLPDSPGRGYFISTMWVKKIWLSGQAVPTPVCQQLWRWSTAARATGTWEHLLLLGSEPSEVPALLESTDSASLDRKPESLVWGIKAVQFVCLLESGFSGSGLVIW